MVNKFHCERISRTQAKEASSDYHENYGQSVKLINSVFPTVEWWIGNKGTESFMLWPLIPEYLDMGLSPPYIKYIGPMFSTNFRKMPYYKRFTIGLSLTETMLPTLLKHYNNLQFAMIDPITPPDVRPILWSDYGDASTMEVEVSARYTATITDLPSLSDVDLIHKFRRDDKRKRISNFLRSQTPPVTKELANGKLLIDFYVETMGRSGGHISEDDFDILDRIIFYAIKGEGCILGSHDGSTGQPTGAQLLLRERSTTLAIAQGVSSLGYELNHSSWLNFDSIRFARDSRSSDFDFCGANSPNRGEDKHAFGAEHLLYFDVEVRNRKLTLEN